MATRAASAGAKPPLYKVVMLGDRCVRFARRVLLIDETPWICGREVDYFLAL